MNAIDKAMIDEYNGVEFGMVDIETGHAITVYSRPVTYDGIKVIIVNAGIRSVTVAYDVHARDTLRVHARKDVVRALTDVCTVNHTFNVVRC